jgi:hypothetical protein
MIECLWNDENLVGPWIFYFAAGWVAAYVDVSPFGIEGTRDVSGLARYRFSRWKHRFPRVGSERRWRGAWFPHDRLCTEGNLSKRAARTAASRLILSEIYIHSVGTVFRCFLSHRFDRFGEGFVLSTRRSDDTDYPIRSLRR